MEIQCPHKKFKMIQCACVKQTSSNISRAKRTKIVVIGGTRLIGAKVVTNLRRRGHDVVAASPSSGVNTITGEGLATALSEAKLSDGLHAPDAARLKRNFQLLFDSTEGTYALVDYVNFKGEGTKPSESYHGRGWGLRQVLLSMKLPEGPDDAPRKFAAAAANVLKQRVKLSPPERNESRYLPGWLNRTASYGEASED